MWDFLKFKDNHAVITDEEVYITYSELERMNNAFYRRLSGRKLLFLQCSNSLEALVAYVSCIQNRIPIMLCDEDIAAERWQKLVEYYRPGYLYLKDGDICVYPGYRIIGRDSGYILYEKAVEDDYPIHQELALLLSTSGTVGSPKQVRISYTNIKSNTEAIMQSLGIDASHRAITALPMSYTFGLSVINTHLAAGGTILLTQSKMFQKKFWDFYRENHGTSFYGVPYMYLMIKRFHLSRYFLPETKVLAQAGGKLDGELQQFFGEFSKANRISFFIMYGQTEATARMSYLSPTVILKKQDSVGKAILGGAFEIRGKENEEILEPFKEGMIWYFGTNVTMGYAYDIKDLEKDDEWHGSLKTGDIGYFDNEGYLYISGRKDRTVKILGKRFSLQEVEELIEEQFKVKVKCSQTEDGKLQVEGMKDEKKKEIVQFLEENLKIRVFIVT